MDSSVYRSKEGRELVEAAYRRILASRASLGFEELSVPTEIALTHVLRAGEASRPPLVMIHGSASNSAAWLGVLPLFAERFRVYCVDIPGEPGLSEPLRCDLESEAPASWLASLLDGLGLERPSFLTMSLGSWYGLALAIKRPERVRALSMITTAGVVPAKSSFLVKAVLCLALGPIGEKLLNRAIYHKAEMPREALEFQALVSRHFRPLMEAIPVFDDAELKRIEAPIQFFGGDKDALIDSVATGARIKRLFPDSDVRILKDTGHVILDQFEAARDFLLAQ